MDRPKEKDLLRGRLKIVDASKVITDICLPGKVNLLHQGRKLIIKTMSKLNPKKAKELAKKFLGKTTLFTKPTKKELSQERKPSRAFIKRVKGKFTGRTDDVCSKLNSVSWGRKKKDKIASFVDPDARFGKTSTKEKDSFCGYKAHISEDESGLITSCDLIKGNQGEGSNLRPLLEKDQEKAITHQATVADSKYDSAKNRREIHSRKMHAYIPFGSASKKYIANFLYDQATDTVIYQEGYSPISKTRQENAIFTVSLRDPVKTVRINKCPAQDLMAAAYAYLSAMTTN